MRTGADYRESLRDGRNVWVMGEGRIDDVTTHPATRDMVDEYVAWYDRHLDPEWQEVLLTPPDEDGRRMPLAYVIPMSADDLRRMGRSYTATLFVSAGNITHDAAYGNLIALGILDTTQRMNVSPEQIANAAAYRDLIARTGRYLTFSAGGPTIGYRFREDPNERAALRLVKETDGGVVIRGKVGMHTSPPFAEDIYIGSFCGVRYGDHMATFVVPVNAPGATVVCRKIAARHQSRFVAPLSHRFDELDGQLWLDDVFIPWERVFLTEPAPEPGMPPRRDPRGSIAEWLFWHQLYCWLTKGEFALGLALACADAMGLREDQPTLEYLTDMVVDVQTVRSCITAAELDPDVSVAGYAKPNNLHIATGSIAMQKARQRLTEILRILPGSSLVVAPSDADLADPTMAAGLEESFGGGRYSALQRSALLQMAWDHISSGLDGRESAFELHCNGGIPMWRSQARARFTRYNELANGVLKALEIEMPEIDIESLREVARPPRRQVTPQDSTPAASNGSAPAPGDGAPTQPEGSERGKASRV
ncbi:MAG: 4-hydroxyphenylacetate 3-hydroxylase N-terminal domain-containing protein [Dehalococcoidia bacterium]